MALDVNGESEPRSYQWVLPLIVGLLGGGLAGSVFTWYVNRPKPTVITYRVASTTLASPEVSGLIPNVKVTIGGAPIQELYAHNVELLPRQGPFVDEAEVALTFTSPTHIFGIKTESPSEVHFIDCGPTDNGVRCRIRPIQGENNPQPYRITLAADRKDPPRVVMAAKGIELMAADQFAPTGQQGTSNFLITSLSIVAMLLGATGVLTALREAHARRTDFRQS